MFPLPRILDFGNVAPDMSYILNIDFSTQQVGETIPLDRSHNEYTFTKYRGTNGVVEYDPDIGTNVYNLASGGCFITPKASDLTLVGFDYEITFKFKNTASTSGVLMESGNYNYTERTGGYTFMLNQTPARYFQMFCDPYPNTVKVGRIEMPGTNSLQWETYVITVRSGQASIYRQSTGETYTQAVPTYSAGNGRYFSLFGDYVYPTNPEYFKGKIASIKIKKLP